MTGLSLLLTDNLIQESISQKIQTQNWGFILFLVCFFIIIVSVSGGTILLSSMIRELFRKNERVSIFSETVNNEFIIKLLLTFETIILLSIICFSIFFHQLNPAFEESSQVFQLIGEACLLFIIFLAYKYLSCFVIAKIFFAKENFQQWKNNFTSIICLSGFILFIPALLLFYSGETYYFCQIFNLIYFIFISLLISYKVYVIFFPNKSLVLYFILYLCAQEIIPLYFLYRGVNYLFDIVQKGTLWLQI
jgi:hypothetical protein